MISLISSEQKKNKKTFLFTIKWLCCCCYLLLLIIIEDINGRIEIKSRNGNNDRNWQATTTNKFNQISNDFCAGCWVWLNYQCLWFHPSKFYWIQILNNNWLRSWIILNGIKSVCVWCELKVFECGAFVVICTAINAFVNITFLCSCICVW